MIKKFLVATTLFIGLLGGRIFAGDTPLLGVVNFTTCITDSKYGKSEQSQLEGIKTQWTSIIEQTEKELKDVISKFEDQEYLDGLAPEAEQDLKMKYKALQEDMAKYQNQLYQVMNQANYFFLQKMQSHIALASETVAQKKNLTLVLNKEACFYNLPDLDVTKLIITEMDKNFEKEPKAKKISENSEESKKDNKEEEVKN